MNNLVKLGSYHPLSPKKIFYLELSYTLNKERKKKPLKVALTPYAPGRSTL
jgi:hypothetical protein